MLFRSYPVAPQHLPELNRQIEVLERAGIIRRSKSLYGAPVLFAPKKDGKLRLCIDYRKLNRQTLRDCYRTPVATDLIARTRGCKMFSKQDLRSGFHQLRIREGMGHVPLWTIKYSQLFSAPHERHLTRSHRCRVLHVLL